MSNMAAPKEKPIVVATAFNVPGHTAGLIQISEHLVKKGFITYFITGSDFKKSIEKAGAEFVENPFRMEEVFASKPLGHESPDGTWVLKYIFGGATPVAHHLLKETLERVRKEHPNREVIILSESLSGGVGPFLHGAPLPQGYSSLPKVIVFHTSVYGTTNDNIPPFGPGLPYDPTPENLALWRSFADAMEPAMTSIIEHYDDIYKSLGATRPIKGPFNDMIMGLGDVTVLATSPSLEYPIPTPNPKLRFIGGLPLKPLDPDFVYPSWWPTITANAVLPANSPEKKKVIFVSQGTAHREYIEVLIPTLNALARRTDLIIVATLGARGAELDSDVKIPENAMVVDYLPYDALLPLADVFVSNAGYGGFMQSVMNGVPMVLAGTAADKAEVCARAEWAGVAVNLRAQTPGEDAIRAAVETVLGDGRYKKKALEVKEENERLDALARFESIIEELVPAE
jgi:UDP:flavonoid glycosyltransferase YjiC (YdhE family)